MLIGIEELKGNQLRSLRKRLKLLDKYAKENKLFKDFLTITFWNNEQYLKFREKKFNSLLSNLKKNYEVDTFFWVAEFQKRGVIHFHLLLLKKSEKLIGFIDKKKAYKDWIGYTTIKRVYTSVLSYMSKYLQKDIVKNRKNLYVYIQHPVIKSKRVRKKIRYRQYSIGGNVRKMKEYKEIMKKEFQKKIEKLGLKIEKENGWNVVKNDIKKIKWCFDVRFGCNGLEIDKGRIMVYEKRYKNLIEYKYEYEYEYNMEIGIEKDLRMFYDIILMELLEEK